jgi:RNA polymerase sigma factor (sigma-70 family)
MFDLVDWTVDGDSASVEWLTEAIDRLPQGLRDLVNAVYWERRSKRSLSRELGVSRAEVQRRLNRAMEKLRDKAPAEL